MERFSGKVVVLTGASEGIGRALALAFAREQPRLVLAARNRDRLALGADQLRNCSSIIFDKRRREIRLTCA